MKIFTMAAYWLRLAILIVGTPWVVSRLTARYGAMPVLGGAALVIAVVILAGVLLLHLSPVGRVNWQNTVGGLCIPWGWSIGRGKLLNTGVACWIIWILLVGIGILISRNKAVAPSATVPFGFWNLMTVASWIVNGILLLMLIAQMLRYPTARKAYPVVIVMILLVSKSMWNYFHGNTAMAFIISGGPLAIVVAVFLVYVGVILVAGKNARWN